MPAESVKTIHHFSKRVLLISLFVAALLSIAGRVLINQIEFFKTEIEQELAEYGITGVSLESIQGSWQGFHPLLKIHGASLSIPGRSQSLSINQLELSVNLMSSLFHSDLKLLSLYSKIDKLILVRDESAQWWLNDIALGMQGDNNTPLNVHAIFQRLPDYVNIDIRLLQIRDLYHDDEYLIQKASLKTKLKNDSLSLSMFMLLPETLGRDLNIVLTGDALDQQLYVKADRFNLPNLMHLAAEKVPGIDSAIVSLESWIQLKKYKLQSIQSDAQLSNVQISNPDVESRDQLPAGEVQNVIRFELQQLAQVDQSEWTVDSVVRELYKGQSKLPSFNSQIQFNQQLEKPLIWVDKIDVKSLRLLLAEVIQGESFSQQLDAIAPLAKIENLVLELDLQQPEQSAVNFEFERLHTELSEYLPAVNGLDGRVVAAQGKGQVFLSSSRLALDFGEMFRLPLKFQQFSGSLRFFQHENDFLIQSDELNLRNPDVAVQARAWLEIPHEGTPFMSLRANYQDGKASATSKYLPVSIMPEETVAWLDSSIRDGEIPSGDFIFHGRLQYLSQLKKNQSGEFHALFHAENPRIDIYGGWPTVSQGKGLVSFHNTEMDISFSQVLFEATEVDQVRVRIPDLFHSELFIEATTSSRADDLLTTLTALPILDFIDEVKQKTRSISGLIESEVNIFIPLTSDSKKEVSVKADATLQNVNILIPEWSVDFKKMSGKLNVDNENVKSEKMNGLYRGDKVELVVTTDNKAHTTNFDLKGVLNASTLTTELPDYLSQPLAGASPWTVKVAVPHDGTLDKRGVRVQGRSKLKGTQLNFPHPIQLDAKKTQQLDFDLTAKQEILDFNITLQDELTTVGRLKLDAQGVYQLSSLDMRFGTKQKAKMLDAGIELNGDVDQLDGNGWFDYKSTYFNKSEAGQDSFLKQVQKIDLNINQLAIGSQQATDTKLYLLNKDHALQGSVISSLAQGKLEIPYQVTAEMPYRAILDYLLWKKTDSETEFDPDIAEMPDLYMTSKSVGYDEMVFSGLIFRSRNQGDKFIIDQLDFARDKVKLKSSGHWQFTPSSKEHVSVFNIDIRGDNFGKTISNLGLSESIRGSEIIFNGQIAWGGSLFNINWPTLIGEVDLRLEDGYLRDVEPGAGRFVGLLSLSAIPKRLLLDFSDVVNSGMQFDKIVGHFSISGDTMYTEDALMDSDAAEVKLKGTTNLREQTYDQNMIIIPKIGDTLPVIGSLAAGNAVGWGLLLIQKIFEKPIEKSVEIEYKVSGSWAEPEVTLISVPEPETDSRTELEAILEEATQK